METLTHVLEKIQTAVWGPPTLVLLMGTGLYFTIKLGGLQLTKFPKALKCIFEKEDGVGDVSSFATLCTTLAACIGTGSIVGVATALRIGGPGALFWMWASALLGMTTKYAEGLLAIKYRVKDENGEIAGGPMYYIQNGLGDKFKWLAKLFAFFGAVRIRFPSCSSNFARHRFFVRKICLLRFATPRSLWEKDAMHWNAKATYVHTLIAAKCIVAQGLC